VTVELNKARGNKLWENSMLQTATLRAVLPSLDLRQNEGIEGWVNSDNGVGGNGEDFSGSKMGYTLSAAHEYFMNNPKDSNTGVIQKTEETKFNF